MSLLFDLQFVNWTETEKRGRSVNILDLIFSGQSYLLGRAFKKLCHGYRRWSHIDVTVLEAVEPYHMTLFGGTLSAHNSPIITPSHFLLSVPSVHFNSVVTFPNQCIQIREVPCAQCTPYKASVLVTFLVTLWDWTYDFGAVGLPLQNKCICNPP